MTEINPPPIFDPIANQGDGKTSLRWVQFFNSMFNGDTGTAWTPTFVNLTTVGGSPTVTGVYYRIGRTLVYFAVTVTPATNTSAVAGTTYINNFPLTLTGNGACLAVSGLLGSNSGMCDKASNRIYVPVWTTVTIPLTIVGIVEAN